jgi:D-alanyl-D-alanine carboxypeptidase
LRRQTRRTPHVQPFHHTGGVPDYVIAPLIELYRGNRFRAWRPRELVDLVAGQPQDFPAGSAWSYSNTGYVLVGMIIERVTGRHLGSEIARRILRPLHLWDTSFPVNFPFLSGPHARGYSLDFDEQLNPIEGRLLDFTVYNPSLAWGAGNMVSDMDDLARFYRALLGGRLLSPELLAQMKTRVEIVPGVGYGLGLFVFDTACGPLWGHGGSIPGFNNELFSSEDGTRQYGLMINADAAPAAVYEQFFLAGEQAVAEAFRMPCPAPAGEADAPAAIASRSSSDRPRASGQAERVDAFSRLRRDRTIGSWWVDSRR